MESVALELKGVSKRYGPNWAIRELDLTVAPGEFVTLLGPSGCGKTTTLSVIAGFLEPDGGQITLNGVSLAGQPPFKRDIGVVFQDYALFPHMTVAENVGYGLRVRKVPAPEIDRRVSEMLELVRLAGLGGRMPLALSGGQRQRVALARALVFDPKFLLLDEPLSNLDLKLREEMRLEIVRLQRQLSVPTIFVTHDQTEALAMSDRVAVLNAGRVEQIGTPRDIYEDPANRFVAEFIGSMNLLEGTIEGVADAAGECVVKLDGGGNIAARAPTDFSVGHRVCVATRPERCGVVAANRPVKNGASALDAVVSHVVYLGSRQEIHLTLISGMTVVSEVVGDTDWDIRTGMNVKFYCDPAECTVLSAEARSIASDNPTPAGKALQRHTMERLGN